MRPEVLFSLFAPATRLKGVGPRLAPLLERLAGGRVVDLIWHLPTAIIDRRPLPGVSAAHKGETATLKLRVAEHAAAPNPKSPYRVYCADEAGDSIALVFFKARADYIQRILPVGEERVVSGLVDVFNGQAQIAHPDYILKPEEAGEIPPFEPVYGLTQGLSNKRLRQIVWHALDEAPALPEWLDGHFLSREGWPRWRDALDDVHHPESLDALSPEHPARRRLAYDELLANQLALALVRDRARKRRGHSIKGDGHLRRKILEALPFKPTGAQAQAMAEIAGDMGSDNAMLRLLQGDVGSGKTLVAVDAIATVVEAGGQAAFLAPTEILSRQHYETVRQVAEPAGIRVALLTGRDKGKKRDALLEDLKNGEIDLLIGTHALFQEDVRYKNLMLAVIDEQHRFGVHQRLMLAEKGGGHVDVLVMTATPIPRTLTLAYYGEMDVSRLHEKPPGRQPIDTRVVALERLDDVVAGLKRAIGRGERAYWVCPLVEDSEKSELAAAEARHGFLKQAFGDQVGLVHGRMKGPDKDQVMADFVAGEIKILVATTVIEVGVDVPEATIMVIEQAERFGLSQLHQLRGRVGRGSGRSVCLLLRSNQLSETAAKRLETMRETEDGFRIAEEDLKLRGAGELLGTKQSGFPEFKVADIAVHGNMLRTAQDDARLIVSQDRDLKGDRGQACRVLLYLFERDSAIRLLHSG